MSTLFKPGARFRRMNRIFDKLSSSKELQHPQGGDGHDPE
jgi:hypothetical protein